MKGSVLLYLLEGAGKSGGTPWHTTISPDHVLHLLLSLGSYAVAIWVAGASSLLDRLLSTGPLMGMCDP